MKKLFTLLTALTLVFAVAGCKDDTPEGPTDAELVAEATTALLLTDLNEVTSNITLPSGGLHSSVVTWSSSDAAVVTDAGVVTRPAVGEDNAVITLTATITIGDESDTKDFTVRVISAVPTLAITIADMLDSSVESGTIVEVTATVIGIVVGAGVQLYDGTGFIYVYNGGGVTFGDTPVAIGDKVVVSGAKGAYFGSPQITDVTSIEFVDGGNDVPAFTPTLIADLFAEDPYDTLYHSNPVNVTGVLELQATEFGSDIYFVETDENNDAYRVLIYYKSDGDKMDELMALEGKMVSADLFTYGYHDGYKAWRATINSTAVITSADLTDEQAASYEIASIDLGLINAITEDMVLSLEGKLEGTTVSWASSNESVISSTGSVVSSEDTDETVILTATITVGTTTVTKDFTVTVLEESFGLESISEILALANDESVVTSQLLVTAVIKNGLYVSDGTDYLFVYTDDAPEGVTVGDYVTIQGLRGSYKGTDQIKSPIVIVVEAPAEAIEIPELSGAGYTVSNVLAGMEDGSLIGKVVQIYGMIGIEGDYNNVYFNDPNDGEVEFQVYYKSPDDSVAALEAENGNVIIATVYVYNNESVVFIGGTDDITVVGTAIDIVDVVGATSEADVVLDSVKVADVIKNGFYVTDGTRLLFIYTGGYPSDMVVKGSEVLIVGEKGDYQGTIQVTGNPVVVVLSDTSTITDMVAPSEVTSMSDLLAGMADGTLISSQVKVTVTISIQGGYDNVFINDSADENVEVVVYYKSPSASIEALEAEEGNTVTIIVYVYSNESVVFVGEASDIE